MPDNNGLLELYKQHQASHDKHTYFLLAAAGTAIGFAVQKTDGLILSFWLLPVAASILCWCVSFYFGCKNVEWVQTSTYANYSLLQLKAGVHPNQPPHPELVPVAIAGVNDALAKNVGKAQFYSAWQFRLFVIGVLFFICLRVAEMAHLTYAAR